MKDRLQETWNQDIGNLEPGYRITRKPGYMIISIPELKTLEFDTLNSDRLINLEIKKKRRSSINLDSHHSKIPSSGYIDLRIQGYQDKGMQG